MSPSHEVTPPWRWAGPEVVLTVDPLTLQGTLQDSSGTNIWTFDGVSALGAGLESCDQGPQGCRAVIRIGAILAGVEIALGADPGTVVFTVSPIEDAEVAAPIWYPPPLRPSGGSVTELALPIKNTNGIAYTPSATDELDMIIEVGGGLTMPMYATSTATGGLLVIFDEPDDALLHISSQTGIGVDAGVGWRDSRGMLHHQRTVTYALLPEPGYVAAAQTYRARVMNRGRFRSLAEKIAERPIVARIIGAPYFSTGYLPFSRRKLLQVLDGLKTIGYHTGLMGPIDLIQWDAGPWLNDYQTFINSPDFAAPIRDAGFVPFAWFYLEDILDFDPSYDPSALAVDRDGSVPRGWVNRDYSYKRMCDSVIANHGRRLRDRATVFSALHFDTTTSKGLTECWSPDHPMTRADDRSARRSWLAEVAGWDLLIGSESGYDWAFDVMDYCSNNPRRDLHTGLPVAVRHIPLQGLIYHDSIVSYCWEYDPYNPSYFGGDWSQQKILYDVMCGNPPTVSPIFGYFPVISDSEGAVTSTWVTWENPQTQSLLRSALPVARLHERTALHAMTSHSYIDDAGSVSRTVFADGTEVIVNAGESRFDDGAIVLDGGSYQVDGVATQVAAGVDGPMDAARR
jgi:hypothetical protein